MHNTAFLFCILHSLSILFPAAVVENEFRGKPVGEEETECEAIGRFLFDWEDVADTMSLTLSKSILRLYVQVVSELLEEDGEGIPVNISISLQLYYKNMMLGNSSTPFQLVKTVNVTSDSEGWIELDITSSVSSLWSPMYKQLPIIEVLLKMEVDCVQHMKVPIKFVNPAEAEVENVVLRAQCVNQQPLFLVFFDDIMLKQVLKDEEKLAEEKKNLDANPLTQRRKKRFFRRDNCVLGNFTLHFNELRFEAEFLSPKLVNIRVCLGSCSYFDVFGQYPRPTYHAYMMAAATYHKNSNLYKTPGSVMYRENHKEPCCSPIKYYSTYLITSVNRHIRMLLYPDMIAAECDCR